MRFKMKIDWWVHFAIAVLIFELSLTSYDLYIKNELLMWLFIIITAIVVFLFVIPFYYYSYYQLYDDGGFLQLRLGILSKVRIPYKSIRRLAPTKKIMLSYSMSYDRLELVFEGFDKNKYTVLVSPKDKEEFIKQLQKRNPDIDTNCEMSDHEAVGSLNM